MRRGVVVDVGKAKGIRLNNSKSGGEERTEDIKPQDVLIINYPHQTSPDWSPDGTEPNEYQRSNKQIPTIKRNPMIVRTINRSPDNQQIR